MTTPVWRVEFDSAAVRDLRKLGMEAEGRVLRYLRERIASSKDPRRFGHALTGDRKGLWRYRVGDYRIVAAIEDYRFVVLIVAVGHRREVYRREEAASRRRQGVRNHRDRLHVNPCPRPTPRSGKPRPWRR